QESPIGARRALLKNLAHALAVDGIFINLIRTAERFSAAGWDDALLEWRNAAACSRGHLRPDGYGVYHRYHETGRFTRDYRGFPTILMVTTTEAAEERIARAARLAAIG